MHAFPHVRWVRVCSYNMLGIKNINKILQGSDIPGCPPQLRPEVASDRSW